MGDFKINHQLRINNAIIEIVGAINLLKDPNGAMAKDILFVLDGIHGRVHRNVIWYALKSAVAKGVLQYRNKRYITCKHINIPPRKQSMRKASCHHRTVRKIREINRTKNKLYKDLNVYHSHKPPISRRSKIYDERKRQNRAKRIRRTYKCHSPNRNSRAKNNFSRKEFGITSNMVETKNIQDDTGVNSKATLLIPIGDVNSTDNSCENEKNFNNYNSKNVETSHKCQRNYGLLLDHNNITAVETHGDSTHDDQYLGVLNRTWSNSQKLNLKNDKQKETGILPVTDCIYCMDSSWSLCSKTKQIPDEKAASLNSKSHEETETIHECNTESTKKSVQPNPVAKSINDE